MEAIPVQVLVPFGEKPIVGKPKIDKRGEGLGIEVLVEPQVDGGLTMVWQVSDPKQQILWPEAVVPAFKHALWKTTCLECFVGVDALAEYREFNLSPSGSWAVYDFLGYRENAADVLTDRLIFEYTHNQSQTEMKAHLPASLLPRLSSRLLSRSGPLKLGLSAVIQMKDGSLQYWALRHPGEQPDFHHPESFCLSVKWPIS